MPQLLQQSDMMLQSAEAVDTWSGASLTALQSLNGHSGQGSLRGGPRKYAFEGGCPTLSVRTYCESSCYCGGSYGEGPGSSLTG